MDEELKKALREAGEALDAFKKSHDEQIAEMKKTGGSNDPVLVERLAKIEASLDAAVEAKATIEARVAAEVKEREELEAKINRLGLSGVASEDEAKRAVELRDFNIVLRSLSGSRKHFEPIDLAGYDAYKKAAEHWMREGPGSLTHEEVKVLSVGVDPDGGYYVTPDISGRIVKSVFETSPIRQIASQQTISTDALEGIEDTDEAGAGYAGEHAVSGNVTTPQVGKWRIPVFWIDTEPKTTQQLLDDAAVNIEAWLSGKVADKFARFENAEFVTGDEAKIRGITSYTTSADTGSVSWGTIGHIATGASGAFASTNPADKLYDLIGALKQAYLPNARFLTRRSVITLIRKFKDGTGNYLWQPSFVAGVPETIMGYPVTRAEDMPAVASNSLSMAFGDFAQGYQIVDRQGIRVLRDNLTSKPYVKFYTTKRVGGGVLNYEAIKVLKFAST
jgi:HK97 family phage major capsid protein